MTSEIESYPPTRSDAADCSTNNEDDGSKATLPKHDQHSIHHAGKTYKRGKARPAKQRDRSPNAWYWKHGEELSEAAAKRWMCELCWEAGSFIHYSTSSNKTITRHLNDEHDTNQDPISLRTNTSDGIALSIAPSLFDWERLKLRLIEWIVVAHITFSQVENDWFRRFLAALSPSLERWIPRAGNTVKAWILAEFERRQEEIKKKLHASKSRIHLSFDL